MPRYFFHARATGGAFDDKGVDPPDSTQSASRTYEYPDNQGVVLPSIEEAVAYGARVARELAAEDRWKSYTIVVADETGKEVAQIPIGNPR